MVDSYVNHAVEKDPDEVTRRAGDNILERYQRYKVDRKKRVHQSQKRGQDQGSGKKLRDKLRINSGLQMVRFLEIDEIEEDDELAGKNQKAQPGWYNAIKLPRNDESKDDQKDKKDNDHSIMNMPKKVVSRQEAKQKDKETKETYPKFKLSLAFGYGQFISNECLFEVYDTKLVSQAEADDATREQRKARRE